MKDLATTYDRWHEDRTSHGLDAREYKVLEWLLDLLEPREGQRFLDVACGQGSMLLRAAARGLHVSGIDVSEVAVSIARSRVPDTADVRVGDGQNLPWPDGSFEFVTCVGSLEHFPSPSEGARELRRVLADGGRCVVLVPNLFFLGHLWFGLRHGTQPSEGSQEFSEQFFSREGWRSLLLDAGFRVDSVHAWNHIWASEKVSPRTIAAWNGLARFLPQTAAYSFAFACSPG